MKAAEVQKTVRHMARACGIAYTIKVTIEQAAHADDNDSQSNTFADISFYGTSARLKIYPAFAGLTFEERKETIGHELAHARLHDYTSLATDLAGSKSGALTQPEERLCDQLSILILSACYEAGVDFSSIAE